jgi:hypothetical protein
MISSAELPNQGQSYQLDPETSEALGPKSPELVWLEVKTLVQQAIQNQFRDSENLRREMNYPVDLRNLTEVLEVMNPVRGVNQLLYANPDLNLRQIPQEPPLKILQSVLRMMTASDRYQALQP